MTKKRKLEGAAPLDASRDVDAQALEVLKVKARARARTLLRPAVRAGMSISAFTPPEAGAELADLIGELVAQEAALMGGSHDRPEAMLLAQAHTLDAIFSDLTLKAAQNLTVSLGSFETLLRLALKAQAQSRATLETLSAIRNPPTVFARQANFATGPQQVNNYASGTEPVSGTASPRAEVLEIKPNELMESHHAKRLVAGAAQTSSPGDRSVAALGAVHRPANGNRQGKSVKKCP